MAPRTRTHFNRDRGSRPGPWKHGAIPVLGLIGGIGGGKSLAAAALARRGGFVLDADAVGHALLDQRPVRERVVDRFGSGVLAPSAEPDEPPHIDRRALGAIVFAQPSALCDLETMLHPIMRRTFERAIARTVRRGKARGVVLDAAILLEAGWDTLCDRVIFVDAPRERRVARAAEGRGWTESDLEGRERAQLPLDQKRQRADEVVLNDAGPEAFEAVIGRLWERIVPPDRSGRADGTGRRSPAPPPR